MPGTKCYKLRTCWKPSSSIACYVLCWHGYKVLCKSSLPLTIVLDTDISKNNQSILNRLGQNSLELAEGVEEEDLGISMLPASAILENLSSVVFSDIRNTLLKWKIVELDWFWY